MSSSRTDPVGQSVPALVGDLRVVLGRLKRRLREQGDVGGLSWSQVVVLAQLERAGTATVTRLASSEGVRPQSMGATVASLEAAGLIQGVADPEDGRRTLLSLTPAGRAMLKSGRSAREDWLSRTIQARLTAAEQRRLGLAIGLLQRLVED